MDSPPPSPTSQRTVIYGPHKHIWDDDYEDEYAYVPNDIVVGNPNVELRDFLRECNVEVMGTMQAVGQL